ncbi:hypothetical protein FJO69_00595 [[Mycoplasma] falconis]|uniref:Phosphatidylinositol diacylglycerol-lyase n=1 Tax=[Mycoplasma] falconis TaxID=92403 RepID=A0A501XC59_9BACT|nr:hypothetical protein [[Mycoplasma] falconis]TPE58092.1 hypothetical protein FJO69_00595 [[Mycoplasma] falconis]
MKRKLLKTLLTPVAFITTATPAFLISAGSNVSVNNTTYWEDSNLAYYDNDSKSDSNALADLNNYLAPKWMKDVNDKKLLFNMSIPSTHDSGTWLINNAFQRPLARTQTMPIYDQLNLGIRGLDIRLDANLRVRHGISETPYRFDTALADVTKFLDNNPSEVVVIRVKDKTLMSIIKL